MRCLVNICPGKREIVLSYKCIYDRNEYICMFHILNIYIKGKNRKNIC